MMYSYYIEAKQTNIKGNIISMTKQQRDWAAKQDWFLSSKVDDTNNLIVIVRDYTHHKLKLEFTDCIELKYWAGY